MVNKKLRLVDNWQAAHTWASMWWSGLGLLVSTADFLNDIWTSLDHSAQERLPYAGLVGVVLFAATMIGRLLVWTHKEVDADAGH
jgi:hypothetical protein